jgi:carbonic anhydrase
MYLHKHEQYTDIGPNFLSDFPESNGSKQSPVNIVSKSTVYDPKLKEKLFTISYLSSRETDILNNGAQYSCIT